MQRITQITTLVSLLPCTQAEPAIVVTKRPGGYLYHVHTILPRPIQKKWPKCLQLVHVLHRDLYLVIFLQSSTTPSEPRSLMTCEA